MKDVIYCLSDAHLGIRNTIEEKRKREKLLAFLEKVKDENADLIIAGDLFDFYFEYRTVIPRAYFDILAKLREIIKSGVNVWFIAGNHDFWVGKFFEDDLGIRVFRKNLRFKFFDKRIFMAHGDGIGRFDLGHFVLQLVLRQPVNIFLFSLLHPDLAYSIGRWVSKLSRHKSSKKHFALRGHPLLRFASSMWSKGYDVVIIGHIHYPHIEKKNGKIFAIIGDWIKNFSYIKLSKNGVSLHFFTE